MKLLLVLALVAVPAIVAIPASVLPTANDNPVDQAAPAVPARIPDASEVTDDVGQGAGVNQDPHEHVLNHTNGAEQAESAHPDSPPEAPAPEVIPPENSAPVESAPVNKDSDTPVANPVPKDNTQESQPSKDADAPAPPKPGDTSNHVPAGDLHTPDAPHEETVQSTAEDSTSNLAGVEQESDLGGMKLRKIEWTIKSKGQICLLGNMTIQLSVTYPVKNKGSKTAQVMFNQTTANSTDGSQCGHMGNVVNATWVTLELKLKNNLGMVMVEFQNFSSTQHPKKHMWTAQKVTGFLMLDKKILPGLDGVSGKITLSTKGDKTNILNSVVPVGKAFKCTRGEPAIAMYKDKNTGVMVTGAANKMMLQVFLKKGQTVLTTKPAQCTADFQPSDIVPIAVGIALAVLVIIVLVAYLIGRRRARAAGYESM